MWYALIFVIGAVIAALVLQRGNLKTLAAENQTVKIDPESRKYPLATSAEYGWPVDEAAIPQKRLPSAQRVIRLQRGRAESPRAPLLLWTA